MRTLVIGDLCGRKATNNVFFEENPCIAEVARVIALVIDLDEEVSLTVVP